MKRGKPHQLSRHNNLGLKKLMVKYMYSIYQYFISKRAKIETKSSKTSFCKNTSIKPKTVKFPKLSMICQLIVFHLHSQMSLPGNDNGISLKNIILPDPEVSFVNVVGFCNVQSWCSVTPVFKRFGHDLRLIMMVLQHIYRLRKSYNT